LKPKLVFIGASTGGPSLIKELVLSLKSLSYTIVIAQHMKEEVIPFFIDDLKESASVRVVSTPITVTLNEAEVIVCSKSSKIIRDGSLFRFETDTSKQIYTPDINQLFNSFVPYADSFDMKAIILTGIGCDGVDGAKNLKQHFCKVVAQDEKSSPVYGMPKYAYETGVADEVKSFEEIIQCLERFC